MSLRTARGLRLPLSSLALISLAAAVAVLGWVIVSRANSASADSYTLVPVADLANVDAWAAEDGTPCGNAGTTCSSRLDEDIDAPDDSDYVRSPYAIDNADILFQLTDAPSNLGYLTDLKVRFRAWKEGTGGATGLVMALENNLGPIGIPLFAALTTTPTEYSYDVNDVVFLDDEVDGFIGWIRGDVTNPAPDTRVIVSSINIEATFVPIAANPRLVPSCGLDIGLVIDSSSSIDAAEFATEKQAFKGFVDALMPVTPTQMSVVQFNETASVLTGFTGDPDAVKIAIDAASTDELTNWEHGLYEGRILFPNRTNPDLIIFASDGYPNTIGGPPGNPIIPFIGEGPAMVRAMDQANAAKLSGIRIIALGIGADVQDPENLEKISSPDAVVLTDFDDLADDLSELARELCGGTITVDKIIDHDGNLATTADQAPGVEWQFAANATSQGDSVAPPSGHTDGNGQINFDVDAGDDQTALVDVTETLQPGFTFLGARCYSGQNPIGVPAPNAITSIPVGANDIVRCVFYNTDAPPPHLRIVKFYDTNANGINDDGAPIAGWEVSVDPGGYNLLTPVDVQLAPGIYTATEREPNEHNWVHTTANSVQVNLAFGDNTLVEFGNVCLGAGGGMTLGFWGNRNGRDKIYDNGSAGPELALLYNLNLRNGSGTNFNPTTYTQLATWLQGANATNMAYMLSAQLAAMALNTEAGYVNGSVLVYAPALLPFSVAGLNAGGFISIADLASAANTELGLHGSTPSGSAYRAYQGALKDSLDNANNNKIFVQSSQCEFSFDD